MNEINKSITIYQLMEKFVNQFPNRKMIKFIEFEKEYSYKEFNDMVIKAYNALIAMGVCRGHHVGLWMDNIEEWYILFFAINKLGGIVVPINTSFKSNEMDKIIKKFDIDYLFMTEGYDRKYPEHIEKIIPNMKVPSAQYSRLKCIITIGFCCDNCISYDDFMKICRNNYEESTVENDSNDDVCVILPTSGTTGMPKGVELTNYQLIQNGFDIGERYQLTPHDKMLIQVPMFHCFGITLSMLSSLTHGTSMYIVRHFNPKVALGAIEGEKLTCMNGVPTMYSAIINHPEFNCYDISSLKKGIMAGSNCYPEFMEEVSKLFEMTVISVYGLSEASPGCTMSSVSDGKKIRYETVGRNLPEVECKIINPNTGKECEIGEQGEFVVRGYNVMQGYYNNSSLTESVIDQEGYLHTGDIAKKRSDGTYEITGRIKDTIIRGGENIYPKEVSMILNQCPGIVDSCVFGVEDFKFGQEVMACIITNGEITIEEIRCFMKNYGCASYKIPRYIMIVDDFIKNAAGKIQLGKMSKVYSKKIGVDK